jgi:hypothetical protein
MKNYYLILFFIYIGAVCCSKASGKKSISSVVISDTSHTNDTIKTGNTIETRFQPPSGYVRIGAAPQSFAEYIRNLPLKPVGSKVLYYDGRIKSSSVYEAVVDMEIGKRDLQQCADACMRLRGEYLYSLKAYDQISFTLVNGFKVNYSEWIKGNRVVVKGNKTYWSKTRAPSNTYKDFREYMDFIFTYASTLSLSKEMKSRDINELAIGDVFVVGGSPGHAVIVVDIAQNKNGEKVFMLAQSYMPAQETQILKNMQDPGMSPWYSADIAEKLYTPEWTFELNHLKTW